jgi:hypothetical protein
VPYIGDLVGARGLLSNADFSPRAQVANTLAYRRRKGTAAVLEQLARDATGWDASVVEYFQLLATAQYLNHLRPENLSFASLRDSRRLDHLNTPFDRTAHTVDVRNIENRRGRYNIPNVAIFLWRLGSYPVTRAPAYKLDDRRYLFDALGKETQLYNRPQVETEITHLAEPINVSMPLARRVLAHELETYYGGDKSLLVYRDGEEIRADRISVCDLSDVNDGAAWAHIPEDKIAIDPVLGRIAFPSAPRSVHASYRYGFSAAMGGGEYEREIRASGADALIRVPSAEAPTINAALTALVDRLSDDPRLGCGVVQIGRPVALADYHILSGGINVPAGKKITLRAGGEHRPAIILDGDWIVTGGADAELELDGLLMSGGGLHLPASNLRALKLAHCTFAPGPSLGVATVPARPAVPSLVVHAPNLHVEVDRSILGAIRSTDSAHVCLTASILDAGKDTAVAYAGIDGEQPGARLVTMNSTIVGRVHTAAMELASNTIFFASAPSAAPVRAKKLQQGCVRFCYVPPGSQLPREFRCQPRTPEEAAAVRPVFTSLRYGDAGYCQLSAQCSDKIKGGADDGAEIGAFHDLFEPQREANLRAQLDEYLRFGLEAGVFLAS